MTTTRGAKYGGSRAGTGRFARQPQIGPYGECWWDKDDLCWRYRLNDEGREAVAAWMEMYPHPVALCKSIWPRLYARAKRVGFTHDEIDTMAMHGVVAAFIRYDPARASLTTAVPWGVRSEVGVAIRERLRNRERLLPPLKLDREAEPAEPAEPAERIVSEMFRRTRGINRRAKKAMRLRASGMSCREIGQIIGVGKSRVAQILDAAYIRLRRTAERMGITVSDG